MKATIKVFKDNMGAEFTPQLEKAWQVTLNVFEGAMISDNYEL